jgi:replicative DNA helicase Mcm
MLPNYLQYLRKYIEYSKRFDPILSEEAENMLKEYYINVALQYGSPRVLESVTIIARMIARLKLKHVVDAEDAYEAQQIYNVVLQQLQQMINVVTDPSDEAYNTCLDILRNWDHAMQFEELVKMACDRNIRVKSYLGNKYKLQDNKKLRSILEKLRNHSQVVVISQKPVVLKWNQG